MPDIVASAILMIGLLNPFLVIIYLLDAVEKLSPRGFRKVLVRAGLIATGVFCCFAVLGDVIFSSVLQADFASFQIFGGIVFLLIGLQFVFVGPKAIALLRGESENLAGAIAMPVLIGPGTISASVVVGKRHDVLIACSIVLVAMSICISVIVILKRVHDYLKPRNADLVDRYVEITGRIAALYVGTIAIEMIMQGLDGWIAKF